METQITPAFTIQDVSELCISQMCISLDCGIKLQRLKWNHSETRTLRKIHKRGFTPPGDRTCKNLQKLSQQFKHSASIHISHANLFNILFFF